MPLFVPLGVCVTGGVRERVCVGVRVRVSDAVGVRVLVRVLVGDAVIVCVRERVTVAERDLVCVTGAVGDRDGVGDAVVDLVCVAGEVPDRDGVGEADSDLDIDAGDGDLVGVLVGETECVGPAGEGVLVDDSEGVLVAVMDEVGARLGVVVPVMLLVGEADGDEEREDVAVAAPEPVPVAVAAAVPVTDGRPVVDGVAGGVADLVSSAVEEAVGVGAMDTDVEAVDVPVNVVDLVATGVREVDGVCGGVAVGDEDHDADGDASGTHMPLGALRSQLTCSDNHLVQPVVVTVLEYAVSASENAAPHDTLTNAAVAPLMPPAHAAPA